ncbi:class I SAM-dependent methyltransferase [Aquipuribacter sp. MA13-6]|uniref:class I SAM-dependent methyltransferase n=1 Tax=unclassified Aquipuribacter TaxID=2635084 RepID=UPI003EEA88EE
MPATDPAADERAVPTDAWDAAAAAYRWQEPLERQSLQAMLTVLAPRADEVVVDLGSGAGHVPRLLGRGPGSPTVALERSPRMLVAGDFAGAVPLRADVTSLPLPEHSVDVVTAAWVLHVLDGAQRAAAVAEIARVLRPGGRLGAVVPAHPRTRAQALLRSAARAAASARGLGAFTVPHDLPALLTDHRLQVRHHRRTGRGYLADVLVCTRA